MSKSLRRALASAGLALAVSLAAPAGAQAYQSVESVVAPGHGYLKPYFLVIHETANPGATAVAHVNLWRRSPAYAVHYVMELDGSVVYHTMATDRKAWHVGGGNGLTYGIELAHATSKAQFDAQWAEAVKWAGDQLRSRGWGIERLLSHNDARLRWGGTDHTDPTGYFREYGRSWDEFKRDVAAYMATGQAPSGGTGQGSAPSSGGQAHAGGSFAGAYTTMVPRLNIRSGAGTGYAAVGSYSGGQKVNLDGYRVVDGWVWGYYTAYSGKVRWVCVGPQTGGVSSRDYLVKGGTYGGSTPSAPQQSSGFAPGRYTFKYDMNVRSGAGTGYRRVASYSAGQSVRIDRTVEAGGYVWGVYTSYSGHTRYVALGTTSGVRYVR